MFQTTRLISESNIAPLENNVINPLYFDLPLRSDYEKLNTSILAVQNEKLVQLLSKDLYLDLFKYFEQDIAISNIATGAVTTLTILDTSLLNDYIAISDSVGLFDAPKTEKLADGTIRTVRKSVEEITLYKVTILDATQFTIEYNSSGSTITQFGLIRTNLNTLYYNLYNYIITYMCYASIANYLQTPNFKSTQNGQVQKSTNQSANIEQGLIGLQTRKYEGYANFWSEQLIDFLEENYTDYILYKQKTQNEIDNSRLRNIALTANKKSVFDKYYN